MKFIAERRFGAGRSEIVFDYFFAGLAVVSDAQLTDLLQIVFAIRDRAIGFEKHVLVKMRQARSAPVVR